MTFFKKNNTATAKLTGNQLVLSLPDAMTPVVWMIDLPSSGSFFMRVDKDSNGLHILQKVDGAGKNVKIEDIAYYSDKDPAMNAMKLIGNIQFDTSSKPCGRSTASKILKTLLSLLLIITAIIGLYLIIFASNTYNNRYSNTPVNVAQTPPAAPTISNDPDAVGVPLSADDFLNQRGNTGLPF